MEQWGFYFNQKRCIGCKACVLACKAWNSERRGDALINPLLVWQQDGRYDLPSYYENLPGSTGEINYEEYDRYCMKENWRRVYSFEEGTKPPDVRIRSLSISCNHCSSPACVEACPVGYIVKDSEYGIVTIAVSYTHLTLPTILLV